jgi:hypothetical protein
MTHPATHNTPREVNKKRGRGPGVVLGLGVLNEAQGHVEDWRLETQGVAWHSHRRAGSGPT